MHTEQRIGGPLGMPSWVWAYLLRQPLAVRLRHMRAWSRGEFERPMWPRRFAPAIDTPLAADRLASRLRWGW